jgi:hypothetical protein
MSDILIRPFNFSDDYEEVYALWENMNVYAFAKNLV